MTDFENQLAAYAITAPVYKKKNTDRGPSVAFTAFVIGASVYVAETYTQYKYIVKAVGIHKLVARAREELAEIAENGGEYTLPYKPVGDDAILITDAMFLKLEKGGQGKSAVYQEGGMETLHETNPEQFTLKDGDIMTLKCWDEQNVEPFTFVTVSGFNFAPVIPRDLPKQSELYRPSQLKFFTNTDMLTTDMADPRNRESPASRLSALGDTREMPFVHPLDYEYKQEYPHLVYMALDEDTTVQELSHGVDKYPAGSIAQAVKYGSNPTADESLGIEYEDRIKAFEYEQRDPKNVGGLARRARLSVRAKVIRWTTVDGTRVTANSTVPFIFYSDECRMSGITRLEHWRSILAEHNIPLVVVARVDDEKSSADGTTNMFTVYPLAVAWKTRAMVEDFGIPVTSDWTRKFLEVGDDGLAVYTAPVERVRKGDGVTTHPIINPINKVIGSLVNLTEYQGPIAQFEGPEWSHYVLFARRNGYLDEDTKAQMQKAREAGALGEAGGEHFLDGQIYNFRGEFHRSQVESERVFCIFACRTTVKKVAKVEVVEVKIAPVDATEGTAGGAGQDVEPVSKGEEASEGEEDNLEDVDSELEDLDVDMDESDIVDFDAEDEKPRPAKKRAREVKKDVNPVEKKKKKKSHKK